MRREKIRKTIAVVLFAASVLSYCKIAEAAHPKKYNIILITVDCLRPDHLGCYGYKTDVSPNIDQLAREGVLFTQAISQATWTWPSMHSIITGTYVSTHGINSWKAIMTKSLLSFPDLLKRREGYTTCFITTYGRFQYMERRREEGFGRGFDKIIIPRFQGANVLTEEALSWIYEVKKQPFFIWLHYMDTHDGFLGLSIDRELIRKYRSDVYIDIYDDAIRFVDQNIGQIVAELKEFNLYENTVIIITADHGEKIGEHNIFFGHGGSPWEALIRVPLIIVYPQASGKERIIDQQVELIDLAPTICDMLKIKTPKRSFEGISLYPVLEGKNIPRKEFTFSEFILTDSVDKYEQVCIRNEDWKLLYVNFANPAQQEYELYNLKSDPEEKDNLADKEKIRFILMKRELEKWFTRPGPRITATTRELSEEAKEELRALGYVQ